MWRMVRLVGQVCEILAVCIRDAPRFFHRNWTTCVEILEDRNSMREPCSALVKSYVLLLLQCFGRDLQKSQQSIGAVSSVILLLSINLPFSIRVDRHVHASPWTACFTSHFESTSVMGGRIRFFFVSTDNSRHHCWSGSSLASIGARHWNRNLRWTVFSGSFGSSKLYWNCYGQQ